jgi:hypothetical protein
MDLANSDWFWSWRARTNTACTFVIVKWLQPEAHHVGTEVKFRWSYLATPPHILINCSLIKHRYSFIFQLSLFYLPIFLLRIFTCSLTLANSTLARISYRFAHSPSPGPPSPVSEPLPSKYDLLFSPEDGGSTFLWNSSTSTKLHFFTSQGILTIAFVGKFSNFYTRWWYWIPFNL